MVTGTTEKPTQDTNQALDGLKNPPAPDVGLGGKEGSTKPERSYTQSEVDALLGKSGQKIKSELETITTERNTFKAQLDAVSAEMATAKESLDSLTKDVDVLSAENPDGKETIRLRRAAEAKIKEYEGKEAKLIEREKPVLKSERDQLVYSVADEFVVASGETLAVDDYNRFMANADKFKLDDREGLVALAETMGLKPNMKTESKIESFIPDSGKTAGGGINLNTLTKKELGKLAYSKK